MAAKITQSEFHNLIESHTQAKPCYTWQSLAIFMILLVGGIIAGILLAKYDYPTLAFYVTTYTPILAAFYFVYMMFKCTDVFIIGKDFWGKEVDQDLVKKIDEHGLKYAGKRVLLKKEQDTFSIFNRHHQARELALKAQKAKMDGMEQGQTIIRQITDREGHTIQLVACTDFATPGFAQPLKNRQIPVPEKLLNAIPHSSIYFDSPHKINTASHYHLFYEVMNLKRRKIEFIIDKANTEWMNESNALRKAEEAQGDEIRDALLHANYDSLCQIVEGDQERNDLREKLAKRMLPIMRDALAQNRPSLFFVNATLIPFLERSFR